MVKRKVLVTGMAGRIGTVIRERLSDRYQLSSLDREPVQGVTSHVADIADAKAIRPAFDGQDTVAHLAADPVPNAPWESVLSSNIVGTYNVLEASRDAGVRRVVFASTNHVVGYYPMKDEPWRSICEGRLDGLPRPIPTITGEMMRPDGYYAVSKHFGESIGSYYHDEFGISFIALRIGGVNREDKASTMGPLGRSLYLSHRDAAHLIDSAIQAPASVGFAIVYGISKNTLRFHDINTAEDLIRYRPQDDAG